MSATEMESQLTMLQDSINGLLRFVVTLHHFQVNCRFKVSHIFSHIAYLK
jgi:hypothetical protein